jgi:protein SCO1
MNDQRRVKRPEWFRLYISCWSLFILLSSAIGCGAAKPAAPASPPNMPAEPGALLKRPAPGRVVTDYPLKGVVKRVEQELEHVRIAHEAIPGFMDAMEMRFSYPDKTALATLHAGDHVAATLRVVKEGGVVSDYALTGLTVTARAPRPPLVLDTSSGKVQLREEFKRLVPGDPVPDFTMTLQDGQARKLSELRGKVVVLTFIYTRCPLPDFCPLMDKKFLDLAASVSSSQTRAPTVRLISLSFDPDHDTPEVLTRHAKLRGAMPPLWTYAVASYEELAKIGAPLGLVYAPGKNEIAHNLCTVVVDSQGKMARLEVGKAPNRWTTADILKTIDALLPAPEN